jgi:phosphomannomutase
MATRMKLGTEGWRGIIARDFTFDSVRACAQGVASYLLGSGLAHRGLIVGYDNRFASEDFAAAVAEVIAGNGIKAYLCPKATPTPVVSYGVTANRTGGGVIITASHNPAIWNGIKYKAEFGGSAPSEVMDEIERGIPSSAAAVKQILFNDGLKQGLIEYLDLAPSYLKRIAELLDLGKLRQAGLKVVIDPMYGAAAGYLKTILAGGSTEAVEINGERNPLFPGINPEPIARNLTKLSATVRELGADVGLATDGDSDRIAVMDENGTLLTPHQVYALLALYLLEVRGQRGAIIKALNASDMLYRLGELFSVPVYESLVGFKYICQMMREQNALIGGDGTSGHAFCGHAPERDGILGGLYFLDFMTQTGKKPSQLLSYLHSKVGPHYCERIDFGCPVGQWEAIVGRVAESKPGELGGLKVTQFDTVDGIRFRLADGSWLLIRFSVSDSIVRVYAEASSLSQAEMLLKVGRDLVRI